MPLAPWDGAQPVRFASVFEAFANLTNSVPCAFGALNAYYSSCIWPSVQWTPAADAVGRPSRSMVQPTGSWWCDGASGWGGVWVYPRRCAFTGRPFTELPTPHGARDSRGRPLASNVHEGSPVGNRVLVYLHGGGYAALAAQNYLYLIGLFLAEQTGQVVLIPEYPIGTPFPTALDVVAPVYVKLMQVYGPDNVILLGDSAGGNLCLAAALNATTRLRPGSECGGSLPDTAEGRRGGEPPAAIVLISPWLGLTDDAIDSESFSGNNPQQGGYLSYGGGADCIPPLITSFLQSAYATAAQRERPDGLVSFVGRGIHDGESSWDGDTSGASTAAMRTLCPIFLTRGGSETLSNQHAAFARTVRSLRLSNPRFKGRSPLEEHTLADDPAAVHVGGTIAMALIYYTSCCSGRARPTTLDYKPLAQAVAMLRFISRVPGWGDIAPLSPITGPRGPLNGWQEPKHWTDDGWAGSLDPASPAA